MAGNSTLQHCQHCKDPKIWISFSKGKSMAFPDFKISKCWRTHMHCYLHARTLQPVHCAQIPLNTPKRGNTLKQHQRASTRFCNASSNFADANWLLRAKTFCPLTAHPVHNHRRQFPRSPGHQYFLILRVMHPPKQFGKFGASL